MATTKKASGGQASSNGKGKVGEVMHEFKEGKLESGKSGNKVTSRKQAVAIALNEGQEEVANMTPKIPKKTSKKS